MLDGWPRNVWWILSEIRNAALSVNAVRRHPHRTSHRCRPMRRSHPSGHGEELLTGRVATVDSGVAGLYIQLRLHQLRLDQVRLVQLRPSQTALVQVRDAHVKPAQLLPVQVTALQLVVPVPNAEPVQTDPFQVPPVQAVPVVAL